MQLFDSVDPILFHLKKYFKIKIKIEFIFGRLLTNTLICDCHTDRIIVIPISYLIRFSIEKSILVNEFPGYPGYQKKLLLYFLKTKLLKMN